MSTAVTPSNSDHGRAIHGTGTRLSNRTAQKRSKRSARARREIPWRRILGAAGVALVVLAVLWAVVYFTPLFAVKNVEVEGNRHLSEDDVVSAAGVTEGTPLAQVSMRDTGSDVVSLPWVKSATVSRKWPSTVRIEVEENTAVAYVNSSGGAHLIDPEGKEFAQDTPPEDAVELTGSSESDDAVRKDAVDIAASLSDPTRAIVESIEAKSPYEFILHLKDGRTVVWGASEDNANKALAVETVLQREGGEFNVTNPRQVTVK